jgi:hypothetical protein
MSMFILGACLGFGIAWVLSAIFMMAPHDDEQDILPNVIARNARRVDGAEGSIERC